jgi:hypothetical protein
MRDKIEQIKQAVAAGQIPREQGADMIGRIVQAEDPELFAGLSAQNAQNKMQQDAASQAGVPGRPMTTPPQQYIPQGAQPAGGFPIGTGPGSTMGNPPQGISEANIPEGYNDPSLMPGSGMPPQMVGGQPTQPPNMPPQAPGLLQQGIGGLRNMGKSLGGYTKSLFNDPSRMALLQGGLSMMDPNSYYDKQGFGSVFTGLNKGLGAAQQGHKGVLDRRALVQKTATDKAAADKARLGVTTNPTLVDIGNGMVQMYQGGQKVGSPYKASAKQFKPEGSSKINKWITEQAKYKPDSPMYKMYKNLIDKESTRKPTTPGNPVAVPLADGMMQNYVNGVPVGGPYQKTYKPDAKKAVKYKTIVENTEDGGQVRNNYKIAADGTKTLESSSDITKLVSGMDDDGNMTVQNYNVTKKSLEQVTLKASNISTADRGVAVELINQLSEWGQVLKNNPYSASEFPGKAISGLNWLSESLNLGTPGKGRAKIDNMQRQMRPLLTPEFIKETKLSDSERKIARASLGFTEWSTGMDKTRAIPVIEKLLRIRAGLPVAGRQEAIGGTGQTPSGYTKDSQSHNF